MWPVASQLGTDQALRQGESKPFEFRCLILSELSCLSPFPFPPLGAGAGAGQAWSHHQHENTAEGQEGEAGKTVENLTAKLKRIAKTELRDRRMAQS